MYEFDMCTTCWKTSGYGLMKICAHCEMNACDECGSFVHGPDVSFISKTDEEKGDKNFPGTRKIWTCQKPDRRCPTEVRHGGLALNYLQTAYRNEKLPPPLPPPPAKRQKVEMEGRQANPKLLKLLPIINREAKNLSSVAAKILHAYEELDYTAGNDAQEEIV